MKATLDITGKHILLLALIVCAALRVPGWYTQEEMSRWRLFETDEEQHLAIIMNRYNELNVGRDTIVHEFNDESYNVRGYGYLNANLLHGWYLVSGQNPNFGAVLRFSRQMSTLYALFLVLVVYFLAKRVGLSPGWAGVAALLVAVCDLHATYSHYALPLSGYLLFTFLSLLGGVGLLRAPGYGNLLLLAGGAAGAVAFKFDVIALLWGGLLLLVLSARGTRHGEVGLPRLYLPLGIAALGAFFGLFLYGWSWESIIHSFTTLRKMNADVIVTDDHLRDNLVAYPMAVLAGIGLPAFSVAVYGLVRLLRRRWATRANPWKTENVALLYLGGFIATEFVLLWYMDTAFVRRAAIFMPAVALLAAYGLRALRAKPWLVSGVVVWSLGLAIVGQSHHWFDTRYAFRDWANEELPKPLRVGISGYLNVKGLKNWRYFESAEFDYFVIHESVSSRFLKSLTTPFGLPECCNGIYHCGERENCLYLQGILLNERDDFELVKTFSTWDVFPERLLYHELFGYYETFLGDVMVYKRTKPRRGDRPLS